MKIKYILSTAILGGALLFSTSCNKDDDPDPTPAPVDPGSSTTELLVGQFADAPVLDGQIDDMWNSIQSLNGTTSVPSLAARNTNLNSDGEGIEESLGLFAPYSGEENDFTMRAGYKGDYIYFLLEYVDGDDSKDRESWYFDDSDQMWKTEHKYANANDDKFYEDKFAFLFPIGEVAGFSSSTCYATCHGPSLPVVNAKDKHTRHYLTIDGQKVDMWHWKRVRGEYSGQVDDQLMIYDNAAEGSAANGRTGDEGTSGYSGNSQTLNNGAADVKVPLYIIPEASDYYWITQDDISDGTAKMITAVDEMGVLSFDGGTINPNGSNDYAQGSGSKRFPSVTIKPFTGSKADIDIVANHTGTGWVCEFRRKLNTGNDDDVVFDIAEELDFGFAIFNNAAIAHGIKTNLKLKFAQ